MTNEYRGEHTEEYQEPLRRVPDPEKGKNRSTAGAKTKRAMWKGDLRDVFDIASADIFERKDVKE